MDTKDKIIYLLKRFGENKCTPHEIAELLTIVNSPDFDDKIKHLFRDEELFDAAPSITEEEINRSYTQFCEIHHIETNRLQSPKKTFMRRYWQVAATLVILLMAGFIVGVLTHKVSSGNELSFSTNSKDKALIALSDQSKVWLNQHTTIKVGQTDNRQVEISSGEAYFEIKHTNDNRRFVVKTPKFNIVVFGTAFDVAANDEDQTIRVSLLRGSIGITQHHTSLFKIKPGQMVVYNKSNDQFKITSNPDIDVSLWKENELRIKDQESAELFERLSVWYGVNIHLQNHPKRKHLYNMDVSKETLANTLDLINKLTPISYKIVGKEVTVAYK